jgi:hypothetical protein
MVGYHSLESWVESSLVTKLDSQNMVIEVPLLFRRLLVIVILWERLQVPVTGLLELHRFRVQAQVSHSHFDKCLAAD